MPIYNSYKDYIENRLKQLDRLGAAMPKFAEMAEEGKEAATICLKYTDNYEKAKAHLENVLAAKLEYAEVDLYIMALSSVIVDDLDIHCSPKDMLAETFKELDKYLPGIATEEQTTDVESILKKYNL